MADEYAVEKKGKGKKSATLLASETDVPAGMELVWTETGMPFLQKKAGTEPSVEDDEAANEHVTENLDFNISYDDIEERFGVGTRVYWHFLVFIIVTNAILALVMGISYLQYLSANRSSSIAVVHCFETAAPYFLVPDEDDETQLTLLLPEGAKQEMSRTNEQTQGLRFTELFISAYVKANNKTTWMAMCIVAVLLTHTFPFAFYFYIKKRVLGNRQNEYDNPFAFSGLENTKIPGNDRYTELNRTLRKFGSAGVYVSLLVISFVVIIVLETVNRRNRDAYKLAGISVIDVCITLVVTGINMFFGFIARRMTQFEKLLTWAALRRSLTIKLYTFKILNVTAMYAAVGVVSLSSACPYFDSGRKFLVLMLTDLVVQNGVEIFMPQFKMRILPKLSQRFVTKGSDEDRKPEFDIAEEYLELFYRQFVIYVGMSLFPLLPFFGLIVNAIEYPLDKLRMTKICQRPKRVDVSLKKLLAIMLMCNAMIALALPPLGTAWTLSGKVGVYKAHPEICPVFGEPTLEYNGTVVDQPVYEPICNSLDIYNPATNCTFETDFAVVEDKCPQFVRSLYVDDQKPDWSVFGTGGRQNNNCTRMIEKCLNKGDALNAAK